MGEIYISKLELKRWSLEFVMLKYIFEILEEGLAKSLWDHVIQIMLREINFKETYSQLRKVKKFGNSYSLKSNSYFLGTVMYVGFYI